ncbi:MAG: transposase [Rhodobacteraceae bacterium]|nr:transposase [Paracoccaceae bacterium]
MFELYVETQLAPTLRKGDVIMLDNLSSHKSPKAAQVMRAVGAWSLFLPPYSPDLKPTVRLQHCPCRVLRKQPAVAWRMNQRKAKTERGYSISQASFISQPDRRCSSVRVGVLPRAPIHNLGWVDTQTVIRVFVTLDINSFSLVGPTMASVGPRHLAPAFSENAACR